MRNTLNILCHGVCGAWPQGALNEVFAYDASSQQLVNTEAGGLQLCLDIDTSGLIQPVEVLAQVWRKTLPRRETAVLLLNADNATR